MLNDIPEWLNPTWCSEVLGHTVESIAVGRIGDGLVGMNLRVGLTGDQALPNAVVLKLPSPDPTSSETGFVLRNYEREVNFYTQLANTVTIRRPTCYHAWLDLEGRDFGLVLEDLAPAQQGNQITGCTVDQARLAVTELAGLHAPRWDDPTLGEIEWLSRRNEGDVERLQMMFAMLWPNFATEYAAVLSAEAVELGVAFQQRIAAWIEARNDDPETLTHGDYRLDNMLFGTAEGGSPVAVVDWQTPGHGTAAADVAYFIGAGLVTDERRVHEQALLDDYRAAMDARGVVIDAADLRHRYRRDAFAGVIMSVIASQIVGRTERGTAMFSAMTQRHFQHAIDLDSINAI